MKRVFYTLKFTPGNNWQKGKPIGEQNLLAHRKYHQNLLEKGKILLGGAFIRTDEGLNILKVDSFEEAKEVAVNDPAVKEKIMNVEIQPLYLVFKDSDSEFLDMHGLINK